MLYFSFFFFILFPPGSGSGSWVRIQERNWMRIHADPNTDPHSTALLSPNYSLHSRTMLNSGSMANTKNTIKENDTILPSSCHRTSVEPFYLIKNSVLDRNRTILDSTEFQARCHGRPMENVTNGWDSQKRRRLEYLVELARHFW